MIIISDTTPLISLLKIDHLDLLENLFHEVIIPPTVYDELTSNLKFADEADKVKNAEFIKVASGLQQNEILTFGKATGLDRGESEAILLTTREPVDLLLMDEVKGRQVARQLDIKIMGTIGILIESYREGYLSGDDVRKSVEILRESGRHISNRLFQRLLNEIEK